MPKQSAAVARLKSDTELPRIKAGFANHRIEATGQQGFALGQNVDRGWGVIARIEARPEGAIITFATGRRIIVAAWGSAELE